VVSVDKIVPCVDDQSREFKRKRLRTALRKVVDLPDGLTVHELGYVLEEAGFDHDDYTTPGSFANYKIENLRDEKNALREVLRKVAPPEYRVQKLVEDVENGDAGAADVLEHAKDFAKLPTHKRAAQKTRLREALGKELNLNDFRAAIRDAKEDAKREEIEEEGIPVISLSDRPSRQFVGEAKTALYDWNDPPTIFQRGTTPTHIEEDDQGRPVLTELPEAALDSYVHEAANFIRETDDGVRQVDLPKRHIQRIMETATFPPVEGIVEVPVMREDGSLLTEPGYDEESQLYFEPAPDLEVPDIPLDPSDEEVEQAVDTIWRPLQDFPFVDQASKANALALMLTPMIRSVLRDHNVPLAAVDATVQGTGKTLYVTVVSIVSTGRAAATMNAPDSDEEWRKQITAQLLQGASMIVVDNVRGRLQSSPLEQALTTSIWQDRVLGQSKQVEIPQRATWVATGNNIQPKGDMLRRVYPIRMDAEMERPWMGREFTIDDLETWTEDHRGELVAAALTLARAWFAAGRPEPAVEPLGSFEQWTRTVGGILEHARVDGFLGNLDTLYETVDHESAEWAGFLSAIQSYFEHEVKQGERSGPTFTSKELSNILRDAHGRDPKFRDADLDDILTHLPGYARQKLNRGEEIQRTLGNMFANRRGRRFGPDQHRVEVEFTRDRIKHWIVKSGRGEGVRTRKNESTESGHTSQLGTPPPTSEGNVGGGYSQSEVLTDSVDSSDAEEANDDPPF